MIFKDVVTQKNDSQKLADISLNKDKSNQLWSELSETSEAAVSGGSLVIENSLFTGNDGTTVSASKKVAIYTGNFNE